MESERYIGEVADACYKQGRRDMAEELRRTLRVAGDDRVAIQDVRRVLARVCRLDAAERSEQRCKI